MGEKKHSSTPSHQSEERVQTRHYIQQNNQLCHYIQQRHKMTYTHGKFVNHLINTDKKSCGQNLL